MQKGESAICAPLLVTNTVLVLARLSAAVCLGHIYAPIIPGTASLTPAIRQYVPLATAASYLRGRRMETLVEAVGLTVGQAGLPLALVVFAPVAWTDAVLIFAVALMATTAHVPGTISGRATAAAPRRAHVTIAVAGALARFLQIKPLLRVAVLGTLTRNTARLHAATFYRLALGPAVSRAPGTPGGGPSLRAGAASAAFCATPGARYLVALIWERLAMITARPAAGAVGGAAGIARPASAGQSSTGQLVDRSSAQLRAAAIRRPALTETKAGEVEGAASWNSPATARAIGACVAVGVTTLAPDSPCARQRSSGAPRAHAGVPAAPTGCLRSLALLGPVRADGIAATGRRTAAGRIIGGATHSRSSARRR